VAYGGASAPARRLSPDEEDLRDEDRPAGGTGFGVAHAGIYHRHRAVDEVIAFGRTKAKLEKIGAEFGFATTTELAAIYDDPSVDLVDVCLPTHLHADHVVRALDAGKHVLCELPLADDLAGAQRIVDAHAASDKHVFVDMFGRFDPSTELLHAAIADDRYGPLKALEIELRSALLWEGYEIRLNSIAMDVMHASLDTIVAALGRPTSMTAGGVEKESGGSAGEVLLDYPGAIARCSASALMPKPYGLRGGWRATFSDAVLESSWTAGYDGRPSTMLSEYTDQAQRTIDLPHTDAYTAVIEHVIACLQGRAASRLSPASVLDTLRVTLDVHHALNPRD
jgi:predicted dehydrogenase